MSAPQFAAGADENLTFRTYSHPTPETLLQEKILADNLLLAPAGSEISINFQESVPEAAQEIDAINFEGSTGRFAVRFVLPDGEMIVLRGQAIATLHVATLNRRISAGEIITADDITTVAFPASALNSNFLRSQSDIIGKEAKRTLMAGRPVTESSIISPRVVFRGEEIRISYDSGALGLGAPGKALEDGAIGQTIRVLNLHSQKTIHAKVTAPGVAAVQPITIHKVED